MFKKPDFLCIGMQKAGTTTLYDYLNNHPQCKMPFLKEFSFFNECELDDEDLNFESRLNSKHWLNVRWRLRMDQFYNRSANFSDEKKLFFCNYLFSNKNLDNRSMKNYSTYFDKSKEFVTGDISPSYIYLEEKTIRKIKESFPDIKIILIVRNPIDREWSQAKMALTKRKKLDFSKVKKEQILAFLKKKNANSNIYYALLNWQAVFANSKLKILFFQDIVEDPKKFYSDVTSFLNIDPIVNKNMISNKGVKSTIPKYALEILQKKHNKQIEKLKVHLKDYPKKYYSHW